MVYDTYVKPDNEITNYLTKYSGVTPEHMANCTTRLADVQNVLLGQEDGPGDFTLWKPNAALCTSVPQ